MASHDGFRHFRARVNGVELHYVREGEGAGKAPLLLVHGWPGFYFEWHLNIRPLSAHFDVVVPDMRGYGHSEKPDLAPEKGYSDGVMAEDLRGLVDHLGWGRVNIVAHDFGAVWTQTFARAYPGRVGRLVLFDPPYPGIGMRPLMPGHLREMWYLLFHQMPWAEALVGSNRGMVERYIGHFLSHWSYDKNLWTLEEVREYVDVYSQPGALRGGFHCYRAMFRTMGRFLGKVPKIEAPTLVLWGENDSVLPVAWSDRLGDYFSHVTMKRVPRCGHFMMRERPDVVNREVAGFVGQSPP
ncbi:MAG: alpha/beta hydrolase [Euryarchaeota archaeon]|nr:alpha/beta hydrolase [Euryarchaeota archaeon]